jgi:hypothetical protein
MNIPEPTDTEGLSNTEKAVCEHFDLHWLNDSTAVYTTKTIKEFAKYLDERESPPSPAIERANLQGSLEAAQQIWGIYNARSRENPEEKMFDFEKWLPGQIEDWERQLAALDKLDKEQK